MVLYAWLRFYELFGLGGGGIGMRGVYWVGGGVRRRELSLQAERRAYAMHVHEEYVRMSVGMYVRGLCMYMYVCIGTMYV